jgi:ABC-type lipoprotein export system ATPase subunit
MKRNMDLQTAREQIMEKYLSGTSEARISANAERKEHVEKLKLETDQEEKVKKISGSTNERVKKNNPARA